MTRHALRHVAAMSLAAAIMASPAGGATRDELAAQLVRERTAWAAERAVLRRQALEARRVARHTPTVREALTIASIAYGVPRQELSAVAWCESTHRPWARNGRYRGLFQEGPMFEAGPYGRAGLSVWSPYASAMTAAYTVQREGWVQWECQP